MSTPMKHAASQQGRTPSQLAGATPPVSTPFSNPAHAAFSPRGPRSSPQQVKKSPATSITLMGQPPSAGALNFDSPSTKEAMRALDIGGGFHLGLDMGGAFSSEDDKLKKLNTILELLNTKKGLVSEAGLARLAQRLGLELLAEDTTALSGRKQRTLVIAGSALALDIVLDNNIVESISLTFHESPPSVARHADAASEILLADLQLRPGQSPLTKTLDQFAVNFELLATLDKLSTPPGFDCQEALAGIFVSLERLCKWDVSKLKEEELYKDKPVDYLSQLAMCAKHGRPVMHARGRVGLAVQYWQDLHHAQPRKETPEKHGSNEEGERKIWSLHLGCGPMDAVGIPPVRVSEKWISESIVKEDPTTEPKTTLLDWQEPDNVKLQVSEENKDVGMELLQADLTTVRVPRVMFNMTFDPPVIMPQNDWMRLYAHVGLEPPSLDEFSPRALATYDTLLFPVQSGGKPDPSGVRVLARRRQALVLDGTQGQHTKTFSATLYVYKPTYAQQVVQMPFSHPRQLVDMLPLLRQYAMLSTLLESSFGAKTEEIDPSQAKPAPGPKPQSSGGMKTMSDELAQFLSGSASTPPTAEPPTEADPSQQSLDVVLWLHPVPQLQVDFPIGGRMANLIVQVLSGGAVVVTSENVFGHDGGAAAAAEPTGSSGKRVTKEVLGRALEHFEDLCKWAGWIRLHAT